MSFYLTDLQVDDKAEIVSVLGLDHTRAEKGKHGQRPLRCKGSGYHKRLSDLGLIPGTTIKILRKAFGCGPIEIQFRSATLVIGRRLASTIQVKKLV